MKVQSFAAPHPNLLEEYATCFEDHFEYLMDHHMKNSNSLRGFCLEFGDEVLKQFISSILRGEPSAPDLFHSIPNDSSASLPSLQTDTKMDEIYLDAKGQPQSLFSNVQQDPKTKELNVVYPELSYGDTWQSDTIRSSETCFLNTHQLKCLVSSSKLIEECLLQKIQNFWKLKDLHLTHPKKIQKIISISNPSPSICNVSAEFKTEGGTISDSSSFTTLSSEGHDSIDNSDNSEAIEIFLNKLCCLQSDKSNAENSITNHHTLNKQPTTDIMSIGDNQLETIQAVADMTPTSIKKSTIENLKTKRGCEYKNTLPKKKHKKQTPSQAHSKILKDENLSVYGLDTLKNLQKTLFEELEETSHKAHFFVQLAQQLIDGASELSIKK